MISTTLTPYPNPYFDIFYKKAILLEQSYINFEKVEPIRIEDIYTIDNKNKNNNNNKICIIKLNGGIASSMVRHNFPKCLIQIKEDYTILDIIMNRHIKFNKNETILLLNSFYTHDETRQFIQLNYPNAIESLIYLEQKANPRVLESSKEILNMDNPDHIYPIGHGELIYKLIDTEIIDKLIEDGIEYIFVSNIDNLNAVKNNDILQDLMDNGIDYALEIVERTEQDKKGGIVVKYDGRYKIVEIGECGLDDLSNFMDIEKYKYFNTNNIWIRTKAIKELSKQDTNYLEKVDIIKNRKKLKTGEDCVQLEYALGGFLKMFDKVKFYLVDRNRFMPIKNEEQLDNLRSDKYKLNKEIWQLEAIE